MVQLTSTPESWPQALLGAYQRYGRLLPVLATALLALLIGRALAELAWSVMPLPASAHGSFVPPAPAPATQAPPLDLNAILRAHLFGQYQAPAPTDTALLEAPDTALNLTLMGVLADDIEQDSRAMIAIQGADERPYAIGDLVTRGVILQAIFPDRVILARGGRLETLRLERDAPSAVGVAAAPAAAAAEVAPPTQQLAQIREEVLRDPAKTSDYIRVQPANLGGQLKGYRVYPGRDRTVFSASGLRPGDLVTSVNGVQLDDPAKALQLLTDLSQASQVTLVVERGGQSQTLSINLQ